MPPTVNELYARAIAGDEQARTRLFQRLTESFKLFAHLKVQNSHDAEEIVQSALATVASAYQDLEVTSSFAAWAHKVLENKYLGYVQARRRQAGRHVALDDASPQAGSWELSPELKMRLLKCLDAVAKANRRYARILNLHQLGFSREEVCEKLEMTAGQSYVVMSRARAALKKCLEEGGYHP